MQRAGGDGRDTSGKEQSKADRKYEKKLRKALDKAKEKGGTWSWAKLFGDAPPSD